jgi:hypothetical protein
MKARFIVVLGLVLGLTLLMAVIAMAQETEAPAPSAPPVAPGPTPGVPPVHVPYDPFKRWDTLPEYPYNKLRPLAPRAGVLATKPAGIDLDVTYISRAPLYNIYRVWYSSDGKPYLQPGTESDQRWPAPGEIVTFTVHFTNKGTLASGDFAFRWYIDGSEASSGVHSSLAPGQEVTESYQWAWAHTVDGERLLGNHTVRFVVDPADAIDETYESNNSLEDRTDAMSLFLAVTPELYSALETPVDPQWPFSAEDWLQKQIAAMNAAFARSIYPSAPNGIEERVRLDKILVTSTSPPADYSVDGGFHMGADDRFGNAYYDSTTDVSGALIHELSHQLGIIDIYNLDIALETPQVLDRLGRPVQIEHSTSWLLGLMNNPGVQPPFYDVHTALGVNSNKGYRRGYYGEYLYDVPPETYLRVVNNRGDPAAGVTVKLYQHSSSPGLYGSQHGTIDNAPEITGTTDAGGLVLLTNRPVGTPVSTNTGHTLCDNPFGIIDVVGGRDIFILELAKGLHQEYGWLDITRFNLAAWQGGDDTVLAIAAHVGPDDAPAPPAGLTGTLESGLVRLQWLPSPSVGVAAHNVYRTSYPVYAYQRIVTGTTGFSYTDSYDYGMPAVAYAVTAVDLQGRESSFADLFYAFRLYNPTGIAVDDQNHRIVLDAQNGYALLYQLPDGTFVDTRGSFDYHLEYSKYVARDKQGHLIFSHPADFYTSRHSVRVSDQDANPSLEFGEQGSAPGQFETPAGVAAWGQPCGIEGPYSSDPHALLLLHLDNSYQGAQGEQGTSSGTTFAAGRYGQGLAVDAGDVLTYTTAGNMNRTQGAVEFWLRPNWDGGDGRNYTFWEVGSEWFNRMRTTKDGANNLRFLVWDSTTEYGVAYNVGDWQSGEWHHIAVTWEGTNIALFIDGVQRGSSDNARPPDSLGASLSVGASLGGSGQEADAVIDEFRISDIPRVGNSDTCTYRLLVADSGNNRIQAFDVSGNYVSAYGSPGSGPGQFNDPQGLAVDGNGQVIVADRGNNRLQVLSFDGTSFGFIRSISADFSGPTGIAAYGADRIIVADTGNNKVKVLDAVGDLLAEYSASNDGYTGTFNQPQGVIADGLGNVVVADTGNRRVVTILGALPPLTSLGDVNDDGLVNSTDALIILSADAGLNTAQFCPMNCGDVNGDGLVNSTDALIVLTYDAGLSVGTLPVGQPGCPSSITQPPGCSL